MLTVLFVLMGCIIFETVLLTGCVIYIFMTEVRRRK